MTRPARISLLGVLLVSALMLALLTALSPVSSFGDSTVARPSTGSGAPMPAVSEADTPTATPEVGDVTLTGHVYDAVLGPTHPISGAIVSVTSCFPRAFPATSDADGAFSLFVPGSYLNCSDVTLNAGAAGYQDISQVVAVTALRAQPQRDFALVPLDETPSPTPPVTVTPQCPGPATPEPLWVDPVTSPTSLLTQTLDIRLGRGRRIEVGSEAGTTVVTGTFTAFSPALVTIPLLPNTTHHLVVTGTVEYAPGCVYGLVTSNDRYGNPLVIVQAPGAPPVASVNMVDYAFDPRVITVTVGTTVHWSNAGNAPHSTTSDSDVWNSGTLDPGGSFAFKFTRAGTYPYYCMLHGSPGGIGMSGVVVVIDKVYLPIVERHYAQSSP